MENKKSCFGEFLDARLDGYPDCETCEQHDACKSEYEKHNPPVI